ncbi:MAG: LPS export ABC transporter periplasmic protein LptC [Endomicrobium sp.]|uniref:LPS export ABC transporter periplasmic protein LptC n=1 Tax=Candidatus Endomicrobiellum pyrsonymphae TaxID=1408203 RepID=UPI00357DA012|nr:LPS export ABC transporter periplasmic protein LptC [Endomicrobium sp.]
MNFFKRCNIYALIMFSAFFFGCITEKTVIEETPPMSKQAIEKFTITQTDEGKLKMILEAESAIIDEIKNIAQLKLPVIKFYDKGKYVSTLVAESAVINMETWDVRGIGKCNMDNAKNEHLQTTNLMYDAKKELVYGDHDVKITRPNETVYGTSFEADTKLANIIIKNQRTVLE